MTAPQFLNGVRAALYLRVSTARQAEHDISIPDQKRQGEAYCEQRGYQLVRRAQVQHALAQGPGEEAGERSRHHGGAALDRAQDIRRGASPPQIPQSYGDAGPRLQRPHAADRHLLCAKWGGAMTLRTGRSSTGATYRYYACSTKARQGKTGCKGRTIPMDKLDHLVADHIGDRLLQPKRLETVLASVIDRRQEGAERRREHLAELHRRIAEADQRLGRLFDAIEAGMIDKDDAMAKERMASLKALRDQAAADAERTQLALDSSGNQGVSPDMLKGFARKARERIRLDDGGYRRDHLRALAQRVEVADDEVRIMGSKSELLRTLVAASSVETAAFGVHSSVLKWRARRDSNCLLADSGITLPTIFRRVLENRRDSGIVKMEQIWQDSTLRSR